MTDLTDLDTLAEKVARALCAADGHDFDEVCGVDADPDEGYCDSSTCVASCWEEHDAGQARRWYLHMARAAITVIREAIAPIIAERDARKFRIGDRVTKIKGSSWTGLVVGFYSTALTPIGYCIESENEPGSVQIYPETALCLGAPHASE